MLRTVCEKNKCTSCMACINRCTKGAIHIEDSLDANNAIIDENKCINCNMCFNICQVNYPLELNEPKYWLQGWCTQDTVRGTSSSGGAAAALMYATIELGGAICACAYGDGNFGFRVTENRAEIGAFVGSKYVKSNPIFAYDLCLNLLKSEKRVLFIGLPCQVAGIKKYIGNRYDDQIVYVELICHGSPSPKVLESFLKSKGSSLTRIQDIQFRRKEYFHLFTDNDSYLYQLKEFIESLKSVEKVEVLPYHTLGVNKYKMLNIKYPLEGIPSPSKERVMNAKNILEVKKYAAKY